MNNLLLQLRQEITPWHSISSLHLVSSHPLIKDILLNCLTFNHGVVYQGYISLPDSIPSFFTFCLSGNLKFIYIYFFLFTVESSKIINLSASARPICVKATPGPVIDFGTCVVGGIVAKDVEVNFCLMYKCL